jgi:hypothetical protein
MVIVSLQYFNNGAISCWQSVHCSNSHFVCLPLAKPGQWTTQRKTSYKEVTRVLTHSSIRFLHTVLAEQFSSTFHTWKDGTKDQRTWDARWSQQCVCVCVCVCEASNLDTKNSLLYFLQLYTKFCTSTLQFKIISHLLTKKKRTAKMSWNFSWQ